MRITLLVVAAATLLGCAGAKNEMAAAAPDGGAMMAQTGTGGSGGAGGSEPAATGGSGGTVATSDAGTAGDSGGTGGASMAPDAGAPKTDAMTSVDSKPATSTPIACDSGRDMLYTDVCLDPPGTKNGKVLQKDGRVCIFCATYKADGRTVEKQFVGCLAAAGALCVMSCSECK